jgi:hypothetical protein
MSTKLWTCLVVVLGMHVISLCLPMALTSSLHAAMKRLHT